MADDAPETEAEAGVVYGRLAGSLGFLLRLSQLRSFAEFFAAFEGEAVRPGEISVLMMVRDNPGVRQGQVARALRIKRAHMTKMVRQMEQDGLVARRVPQDDRRAMELRLTPAGAARLQDLMACFEAHESRTAAPLSQAEEAELKRLLRKYLDLDEGD